MKLIFATGNPGKLHEAREILGPSYEVLGPADLGLDWEIEETGNTFQENSLLKAKHIFNQCGLPCFADDSGLEVDVLDGAPGIHTARYASDHNFADNIAYLLFKLGSIFPPQEGCKAQALTESQADYVSKKRLFAGFISRGGALPLRYNPYPERRNTSFFRGDCGRKNSASGLWRARIRL